MEAADWDARYAAADLVWSAAPNAALARETAGLQPGRALDLASGEGRNAIWLAQRGWHVTAVDFSPVASARARRLADERLGGERARMTAVTADVLDWAPEPAATYDLVLLAYVQLAAAQRTTLVRKAATLLASGGVLLVIGHHLDNLTDGVGGPQDPAVLFTPEDLKADLAGAGLVVDRAETLRRPVETQDALDAFLRAHRP